MSSSDGDNIRLSPAMNDGGGGGGGREGSNNSNNNDYSYSPAALLDSFAKLIAKEEELLQRASSSAATATATTAAAAAAATTTTTTSTTMPSIPEVDMGNALEEDEEDGTGTTRNVRRRTGNADRGIVTVAATQITGAGLPDSDVAGFCFRAEQAIEAAANGGAQIVLLPELWSGPYFCQSQVADLMGLALPCCGCCGPDGGDDKNNNNNNVLVQRMQLLAKLHRVVLPVSLYERHNNVLYNSVIVIDSDGQILGKYRKSHIPDGTGYQEKFYFAPGDTGFKVFYCRRLDARIGVGICWDQWFPEAARAMALMGADLLLYPTAIGSEPQDPAIDSSGHWRRAMQGHAAANMVPVVASNRYGTEILLDEGDGTERQRIKFYGKSFITDHTGEIVAECPDNDLQTKIYIGRSGRGEAGRPARGAVVATAAIDIERNRRERLAWGLFRDRRPELYGALLTKDGGCGGNGT